MKSDLDGEQYFSKIHTQILHFSRTLLSFRNYSWGL